MIKEPTLEQVQVVVKKLSPDFVVGSFNKAPEGNINWVYFINLIKPKITLVLKIAWRPERVDQEILKKEAFIIQLLNKRKIKLAPRLLAFDQSKKDLPYDYLIESFLPGQCLMNCFKTMPAGNLTQIIQNSARFIKQVQTATFNRITEFEPQRPEFKSFAEYVNHFTPRHARICLGTNKISKQLVKNAEAFILANAPLIKDKKFVLNYGDVSCRNFLVYHHKLSGALDFEASQTMVPEFDLVTFYHEFLWQCPEQWPVFLRAYAQHTALPSDFKQRLNIVMGYRSLRYLSIAIKHKIYTYLKGDIIRMEEVLNGRFIKTLDF